MKVTNRIKLLIIAAAIAFAGGVGAMSPVFAEGEDDPPTAADDCKSKTSATERAKCYAQWGDDGDASNDDLSATVKNIIQVITGIVGLLAVVMIIYGGITYTTSAGDTAKVTKAKNIILYGIVGLVIALLAFAIVTFVLGNV